MWGLTYFSGSQGVKMYESVLGQSAWHKCTRAHHGDEIRERDVTYHLIFTYLPRNYDTPVVP